MNIIAESFKDKVSRYSDASPQKLTEFDKVLDLQQRLTEARESIAQQPPAIREQLAAYFKEN